MLGAKYFGIPGLTQTVRTHPMPHHRQSGRLGTGGTGSCSGPWTLRQQQFGTTAHCAVTETDNSATPSCLPRSFKTKEVRHIAKLARPDTRVNQSLRDPFCVTKELLCPRACTVSIVSFVQQADFLQIGWSVQRAR